MKVKTIKCPECMANLEIEKGLETCYCKYCGCQIFIDSETHNITINKNINITKYVTNTQKNINEAEIIKAKAKLAKVKAKDKENKRQWIAICVYLLILCVLFGMLFKMDMDREAKEKAALSAGMISVGNYKDYVKQDYKVVVANFEAAGFINIEIIDLNDSGIFFWTDGKVEQISIEGNTTFESTDYFSPKSKVVISYH